MMISVVVPIYNEEELVLRFHEAIANTMEGVDGEWEVAGIFFSRFAFREPALGGLIRGGHVLDGCRCCLAGA